MTAPTTSAATTAPAAPAPVLYSWLITCQWPTPDGMMTATNYAIFSATEPFSRADALERIRATLVEKGVPRTSNVLFFSLERDEIVPEASR